MKLLLPVLCLISFAARATAGDVRFHVPSTRVPDEVLLSAIAEVETGNNPAKRGRYGERTQLQIRPETWREFSHLPHSTAVDNPAETDRVARAYLAVIRAKLRSRGLPESPFFIAASWNAGPGWRRLGRGTVAYAEHVTNLVEAAGPPTETEDAEAMSPTPIQLPTTLLQGRTALTSVDRIPTIDITAQ